MYKIFIASCAALLIGGGIASANGPLTKPVTAVIHGTANPALAQYVDTDGQCNVAAWVDHCSAASACQCFAVSPATAGGAGTISNFFITVDSGINPATEPPPGGVGPNPKCNSITGVFTLSKTKSSGTSTTTINLIGTTCKHVVGISVNHPNGTDKNDILSGGWGVSDTPTPSPDVSGWGTFTGQVVNNNNGGSVPLSLRLAGMITK